MSYIVGDLIKKAKIEKCKKQDFPVLSMTMKDGIVFQNDRFKKQIASIDKSSYNIVKRNQLVVSFPIDEGVLAVQDIIDFGIVSPAYKIWDINDYLVIPKFLEAFLRSPHSIQYYKSKLHGSTARRRTITDSDLLQMEVPLVSFTEQKRILENIRKVKHIITHRRTQLEKLDLLVKARFVEMFGDPITNSKNLETKNLKDVMVLKAGDFTAASDISSEPTDKNIYPCFGGNGIRGYVSEYNQDGDFSLIGRQGALSGNVQYARGKFKNTEHALLVTPTIEMNSIWLNQLLLNLDLKRYQTGAAQPGLSVKNLQEIPIIQVEIPEQTQFADFVKQVDKSRVVVQKALDEAQLLFDSLMQEYFD